MAAAGKHSDDVDGFSYEGTWDCDDSFLDELFKPSHSTNRCARMNGADAAGMTRPPGLEQIKSLRPSDLANRDAIGPQPK